MGDIAPPCRESRDAIHTPMRVNAKFRVAEPRGRAMLGERRPARVVALLCSKRCFCATSAEHDRSSQQRPLLHFRGINYGILYGFPISTRAITA